MNLHDYKKVIAIKIIRGKLTNKSNRLKLEKLKLVTTVDENMMTAPRAEVFLLHTKKVRPKYQQK